MTVDNAPKHLIHGTYARHIDSIMKEGLIPGGKAKGSRNENHFATAEAWDRQQAGYRYEAEVSIYCNIKGILSSTLKLWISKSGAIVTEDVIGLFYMDRIIDNRTRDVIWMNPRLRAAAARLEQENEEAEDSRGATLAEEDKRKKEKEVATALLQATADQVRETTLAVAKRGAKSKGAPKPPPPYHATATTSKAASPAGTSEEAAKEKQQEEQEKEKEKKGRKEKKNLQSLKSA